MIIDQAVLDKLTEEAKASPRLRINMDLRNSTEDTSQRMLNALEPGTQLPIHRHTKSSETVVCLRGRLVWEYYQESKVEGLGLRDSSSSSRVGTPTVDATRQCSGKPGTALTAPRVQKVQEIELSPNGPVVALNIPAGQWHTVKALESGSVIIEMKDGPYEPQSDEDILK